MLAIKLAYLEAWVYILRHNESKRFTPQRKLNVLVLNVSHYYVLLCILIEFAPN